MELPDVYFGSPAAEPVPLVEDDSPDDDEELPETPADVVALLGFDPLDK